MTVGRSKVARDDEVDKDKDEGSGERNECRECRRRDGSV